MLDTDALRRQTGLHEGGHSLMAYLLVGTAGGLEVKWLSPGSGLCFPLWPQDWARDDEVKVWTFSALIDIAGLTAERLFDPHADPKPSAKDLENLDAAAHELAALCGTAGDPGVWRRGLTDLARHLLRPHTDALDTLASLLTHKERWTGRDVTTRLWYHHPELKRYPALLEGDDWWVTIEAVIGEMERAGAAQWSRYQALQQRIERRVAEYQARQASGLETKRGRGRR